MRLMGKYRYTKSEQEFNNVLKYQDEQLKNISFADGAKGEKQLRESEELLKSLGKTIPQRKAISVNYDPKQVMEVPSWDSLSSKAVQSVGNNVQLEDLFTPEELKSNQDYVLKLNAEYNQIHHLDKYDICISVSAGMLAAVVDILMIGIPKKTPEGLKGGPLSNYVRDWFDKKFPEEEMQTLANSKKSKVPYDAQDNRNTATYVDGLSTYYHRLLSLGHDPLLGFIVGVLDILTGKMTTIDKSGKIVSQVVENYADRKETDIFKAIAKQIIHLKSDITTSMGLPAPLMGLFNLLQFGSIGKEEQTIAEIVQGMYYEGYDFIHFCTLSIPVMIEEVVTRLGYAIKRIKEGYSIKDSIPFSIDHDKHPKLGTMLFIAHSSATAMNAGKVLFTKNPMAINYPQWIAFTKYSYKQLKWSLLEKPAAREKYVMGKIDEQLDAVYTSIDDTFENFSKNYVVIMD